MCIRDRAWSVPLRWRSPKRCTTLWRRRWKRLVNKKKLLSLIGLATRARKVVSGEFSTEKSVKSGRSHLVIVSEEASENTKKMFTNMCTYYKVPIYLFGTKDELGHAMGQEFRASLSVEDVGFAKSMAGLMNVNGGSVNESK